MRCFVTGCAGFIGSNLTDRLLALGHDVTGYDNLSTGQIGFLQEPTQYERFRFIEGDLLDAADLAALGAHHKLRVSPDQPRNVLAP